MDRATSSAAIILAAGSSSRMGQGRHKLQLPLGDRPVLAHVIDAVLASQARPIVLVLGHRSEQIYTHLTSYMTQPALRSIENPEYQQGMSTSIRRGIQELMNLSSPDNADSALIVLGDQPFITSRIIDLIIATRHDTGKRIITPLYAGKRGTPTLFDASLFPELLKLSGDEGARSLLEHYHADIAAVEVGDAVANYDVDTWEAYQQALTEWDAHSSTGC